MAADADRLRRFRAEAHAVSSLNHPHILVIHDFGDVEGRPFMVTELVEGATLRQRMAGGPLSVREAVDIAVQVASALTAAHGRGLVHRDIKPENVILRPDGYVPFRAPHHTISDAALVGGGTIPRPGEVSLAHHGVLFPDEMLEFDRRVLEALRQPIEEGRITVSRAVRSVAFPVRFVLVAAMNPCPCGYHGDDKRVCR